MRKPQVWVLLALVAAALLASPAQAASDCNALASGAPQDQGYETLDSSLCRIHYPDGMAGAARRVTKRLPDLLADAEARLDLRYEEKLWIWIERDHEDFNRRLVELGGAERPEHVAAVAFPYRDTILLKSAAWQRGAPTDFDVTLQHEIVHCMLGSLRRRHRQIDIPTWLDEGIAQWASEPLSRPKSQVLAQALRSGTIIPFAELRDNFPDQEGASALAYAQSLSIVRYIAAAPTVRPERNIPDLIIQLRLGADVEEAVLSVTELRFSDLERGWTEETRAILPFDLGQLGEILFGLAVLVLSLLAYASARARRERLLAKFDAEEANGGVELELYGDDSQRRPPLPEDRY